MNSAFWSGLIEAIVAFFSVWREGHDGYRGGVCLRNGFLPDASTHTWSAQGLRFYVRLLHSRVRFALRTRKGPLRLKGQPCCRAIKKKIASRVFCVTLQMCYFQTEGSSVSEVWPHILAWTGPCWLTGLVQMWHTYDIMTETPLCQQSCPPTLLSSSARCWHPAPSLISPHLAAENCICIMLFVFAEITDPGTNLLVTVH